MHDLWSNSGEHFIYYTYRSVGIVAYHPKSDGHEAL